MDPRSGGVCQAIRTTIPELQKLGCTSEVVCVDSPELDYQVHDPFKLHKLGPRVGPWAYSKRLAPWLRNHANQFDTLIVHGLWSYHSYVTLKIISQYRSKHGNTGPAVYVMPHGMLDPWFQRDASRRLKAWRNWWYWKLIEKNVISQADGLLFTCQKELELAREPFRPYRPKAEAKVGLGVAEPPSETDAMQTAFRAACPQLNGRPYWLFLSRIHPKKGVELLLKAYALLAKEPNLAGKLPALVIAGPTDSAYAQQMQQLARELGAPQVYFPGMLIGDAKWGAFYGCEAFVLPSHQENFGIAVVESLACHKPVLISNQINIYQEIVDRNAGIVGQDTQEGVIGLLRAWLSRSELQRAEMQSNARACFLELFQATSAARRLAEALCFRGERLEARG
jgi:glycosyltransferase involved in cell wall biosynthesis